MNGRALLLCLAAIAGACGDDGPDDASDSAVADATATVPDASVDAAVDATAALCAERTGGALITFDVVDEPITLWTTDGTFIDEAIAKLEAGERPRIPNFGQVIAGTDCDARWSFHVAPGDLAWADFTIELCDATPSYIDGDVAGWIASVGTWCPWGVEAITSVDDRR